MRQLLALLCACAALAVAACNPNADTGNSSAPPNSNSTTTTTTTTTTTAPPPSVPPISTAHGGSTPATAPAAAETPEGVDTAALDAKIEKLEAKVKGGGSDADKKALAAVYLERANVYRDAGSPRLYKFALGDYRRVLRLEPNNAEARTKMDEIVSIYQSLGRPVPTNGLEP